MKIDNNNPYVGLRPFEMDESILFFGRNEQTLELLQRLHQHHFVAVVGSSGCGKSSLLRAGLIPSLKAGYLIDDSDKWFVAIMKPGKNPLYNLAESILRQVNTNTTDNEISAFVQKINEGGADVILDLIAPIEKEKNINFFLLVDQFEELFRFAMDQKDANKKDEAIDFVNIILELSLQKNIPFFVVITMRSDFIGDCTQFNGLPETLNKSQYLVPRLNRMEMKMAIEGPSKLYGGKFNPTLTSRLLNELGKVKDELPLLQHALMRMWDFEIDADKSGEINLIDYNKIGGIEKALNNHADEALAGLSNEEQTIARKMFQALTAIDESGRKIRRPALLSQLKELTGATEEQLLKIIHQFIEDRRSFLVINKDGSTDERIIDISHESLIRQWNTLSQWVDEEGESASNYLQLTESARLHTQNKKDFLAGSELQITLDWYNKFKPSAAWANRYNEEFKKTITFLKESENDNANARRKEKSRKRTQRLLTYGIGLLFLVAAIAFLLNYNSTKKNKEITDQYITISKQSNELQGKLKLITAVNDTITAAIKSLENETDPDIIYTKLKEINQSLFNNSTEKIDYKIVEGDTRYAKNNGFLKQGEALESKNKKYLLVFSVDGNLSVYKKKGMFQRWSTNTIKGIIAGMLENGNFVINSGDELAKESGILWGTKTDGHPNAYIVMQEDGNLVIYDDAGDHKKPIWASGSFDPNWEFDD